jgi:hypothetical protein
VQLSSEKIHLLHICNASFFKNVVYRVSLYALKEMHKQCMKAKLGTMSPACSGRFIKLWFFLVLIEWRIEEMWLLVLT